MSPLPVSRHSALLGDIKALIFQARSVAARQINSLQVLANFEIGRRIVEEEQLGADRADYGTQLLKGLALALTEEFGAGFSKRNLDYMRKFFLVYRDRLVPIVQKPSAQLLFPAIPRARRGSQWPLALHRTATNRQPPSAFHQRSRA